jgi:hypothetical protein
MDEFQTEGQPLVDIKKEGLKIGLLNGAIALLILFGSYYIGIEFFMDVKMVEWLIPYMIAVLLIAGIRLRKKNGSYLTMKQGIQFAFLSYIVAEVMIGIGTHVLYNVIHPELGRITFEKGLERTITMMKEIGAPQKDIDEEVAKARKAGADTGFKNIFLGTGLMLIWDFMKSLLISLVIRKEKPAF